MFLKDVAAWQATFLTPMHIVAKALGGGSDGEVSTTTTPDGKTIRTSLPTWHRKHGVRGAKVWDLDNDPRARGALIRTFQEAGNAGVRDTHG